MTFEIKSRDAAGRIGIFRTKHGTVTTPNLMPVINPNKMLITPKEMKKLFGTEMVITNSYIIKKDKKLKEKVLRDGVHKLIDFDGPIMTDSGTFQSYVYGDVEVEPLEIVEFQRDIGSDVGTILDVFTTPDKKKNEAEKGLKETVKRAKESAKIKGDMALACTVQGSIYPDLREKCAKDLSKIDADFFPIGGVVPLMENQQYKELAECIIASKKGLDPSKPVHLFGAGHPLMFSLAVALGCDFFDSSAYIKYAADMRMMFPWGTLKLDDVEELPCCCPVCSKYSALELKKINFNDRIRLLAEHNLFVSFAEIKRIKNAIKHGSLWELVERRAASNPYLLDALRVLENNGYKDWLEQFDPVSRNSALFYTGRHTIHRPIIHRYHKRALERYVPLHKNVVIFPEAKKPYTRFYHDEILQFLQKANVGFVVETIFGPIPLELDEMYPFAQSIVSEMIDVETTHFVRKFGNKFYEKYNVLIQYGKDHDKQIKLLKSNDMEEFDIDLLRIKAVVNMQFGKNVDKALFNKKKIKLVKSKKTGKIRNVYIDNEHALSMRAHDGLFTLKIAGGKLLHKSLEYPKLRVTVKEDCVPFVKEGKSVFAKFVNDCDSELRPLDECLVVDEKDQLLAVGRTLLNRIEMLAFNRGVAVKTKEHVN
ncbi:archaeosine tRNA-ribosyltransferase [Thermoplasmatales archaeon SCGC AB-539-N05]|nr:archaeosine tRNA-ribosyltransferase [Thermoplasmatales archaeon SCGC AB-539-N05]